MKLKIAEVSRDRAGLQARREMNDDAVLDYGEKMAKGARFPAVVVFDDGAAKWLADGFHRIAGAELAGLTEIEAEVRPGSKLDALRYAVKANDSHGLRRTTADKERAVELLLATPEFSDAAVIRLAEAAGVSDHLASRVAGRVRADDAPGAAHVGRDGKTYKARLRRTAPAPSEVTTSEPDQAAVAPAAPTPTDDLGDPLTGPAAEAFAVRERFAEAERLLRAAGRVIEEMARLPGSEVYRSKLRLERRDGADRFRCPDVHNAIMKVQDHRPHAARCPACKAAGHATNRPACRWCHGMAYLTEATYKRCVDSVNTGHKKGRAAA